MRSYSPGALATIALWKSTPMELKLEIQYTARCHGRRVSCTRPRRRFRGFRFLLPSL